MSRASKRHRRKPDVFSLALILALAGTALTLMYQVHLYYGAQQVPIARQAPVVKADDVVDG